MYVVVPWGASRRPDLVCCSLLLGPLTHWLGCLHLDADHPDVFNEAGCIWVALLGDEGAQQLRCLLCTAV
jgi:hypothetical protein